MARLIQVAPARQVPASQRLGSGADRGTVEANEPLEHRHGLGCRAWHFRGLAEAPAIRPDQAGVRQLADADRVAPLRRPVDLDRVRRQLPALATPELDADWRR